MWAIWSSRNEYTHEEVKYQPGRSMVLLKELIQDLYIPADLSDPQQGRSVVWTPPEPGCVKINTDAAVDVNAGTSAVGLVARDPGGLVLARSHKLRGVTDPYVAELLGVREAVRLAMEKGWTRVTVETDCQTVTEEWVATTCRSMGSPVISEIKTYLQNFQELCINYVRREANQAAHWCAQEGLRGASDVISYDVFPVFLIALVQSDVNRVRIE
ncbi:hypothetical protein VPH35_002834 [Triticum aestivum]